MDGVLCLILPRMFQTNRYGAVLSLSIGVVFLACRAGAQAPLVVNGVADRTTYTDSVTVSVPSTAGYIQSILLDGSPLPPDLSVPVNRMDYHELLVSRTNVASGAVSNRLVRFIVRSSNRGSPETGLMEWLPYPMIDSTAAELAGAQLNLVTPEDYPLGLEIPVAARIETALGKAVRANATVSTPGQSSIRIRRGIGSGYFAPASSAGSANYEASIPGIAATKTINLEAATTWTGVSGALNGAVNWPDNSRIAVTGTITIPTGSSLTVGQGTVVRLNAGVDVIVRGRLTINGTVTTPVVFTPINRAQPWGGLITTNDSPARIDATGTFFVGTGAKANWFSGTGYDTHLSQQACFVLDNAIGNFTDCFLLDGRGQVGHAENSSLTMTHCIAQRFLTGGEYVGGTIIVDKSAFIEFPADDGIVNATIADADNDGIYFTTGTHILTDSLFGWCKDDAIDSGSGGTGTVVVSNCWVESALHESLAWSGTGRQTWTYDTVVINSGQGIECGWSSSDGSPNVFAERLLSTGNSVGARFGDNYDWDYWGTLRVTNALILNNYRDIWGMNWDNWLYGIYTPNGPFRMDLRGNFVTQSNTNHPGNTLWNGAADGWRLAPFLSTPPGAAVGVGLAVWTNQFAMSSIFQGVPVRLSSFATNAVSVDYTWLASDQSPILSGTLTFAPGETVKRIYPDGLNLGTQTLIRLALSNPVGGEVTGLDTVTYQGSVPGSAVTLAVSAGILPGYRILEGTFVRLTAPSAQMVSVRYTNRADGQVLSTGTLIFNPRETLKQLVLTGANPFDYSSIEVSVGDPINAALAGIRSVIYTNPPLTVSFGVVGNQADLLVLSNGLPVGLNGPASSAGAGVDFRIENDGGVLTNGTMAFAPGETLKQLTAPSINLAQQVLLRVVLANPTGALLGTPSNLYLVKVVSAPPAGNVTLIPRGARWRYRDLASDPGATWRNTNYNDSAWPSGFAQLGFSDGEGDEVTPIADNNQITSYFRTTFNVSNPAAFTNLSMWLLRDDAGVVHINGREVFRSPNLPAAPTAIGYSTLSVGATVENFPDTATLSATNLWAGTNWAAVEIHQQAADSSDVSFDFELIGNAAPPVPPPQYVYFGSFTPGLLTIAWGDTSFRLERTDVLNGTNTVWTQVPSLSPANLNYDQPQRFFRLRR